MPAAKKPAAKAPAKAPAKGKGWTPAKDDRADRKAAIKENGPRDKALDRKRGVK